MLPTDSYAPPKADVLLDADVVKPRIPLTFKILLGVFFLLHVVVAVLAHYGGLSVFQGVMGIAAWRTLQGHGAASRVLGVLLALYALPFAFVTWQSIGGPVGPTVTEALLTAQVIALVGYIFFNPSMQAAFAKTERNKWSGG